MWGRKGKTANTPTHQHNNTGSVLGDALQGEIVRTVVWLAALPRLIGQQQLSIGRRKRNTKVATVQAL
jgi:hypothetical protein